MNNNLVLNRIREVKKLSSETELASYLGITTQRLANWRARNTLDHQLLFTKCDGIDLNWLITGEGEMLKSDDSSLYKDEQNKELAAIIADRGIPLIPLDAFAGFGMGNNAQVMEYECDQYVVPNFAEAEFLIQVKGNSMYPKYSSGDIVACKKLSLDTFFQWNKVYVIDSEQGVLIKRVKKGSDDDHILLVSENIKYDSFELHKKEIQSLAIVVGVIRLE